MKYLVWSPLAKEQIADIFFYYKFEFGISTARKVKKAIQDCGKKLKRNPYIGRIEPEAAGRSHIYYSYVEHPNHKIIYYMEDETLYIADIWPCLMNTDNLKRRLE